MRTIRVLILASLLLLVHARAEEGFWPFDMIPKEELSKKFNVKIDQPWLDKIRLASLRFQNGGSGSFVSPNGLIMTNHHVASELLQSLSTAENDLVKKGFHAKTTADELRVPDLELNQLVAIEDVTGRVKESIKPGLPPEQAAAAREKTIAAIQKESFEKTGLRSDVVAMYRGAEYYLYRYKRYTDIRLVFAPEADIGFFGGDPDNFTYPRFDLDVAFFRVYENGKPFETPHWFRFSKTGAKDGDVTIVSGNPGGTHRLQSVADLEFKRDVSLPLRLKWMERSAKMLHAYAAEGPEQARNSQEDIFGIENELKAARGEFEGLKNPEIVRRKREAEEMLIKTAPPAQQKELDQSFATIAKLCADYKPWYKEHELTGDDWGLYSDLFNKARTLVRAARERAKPDGERERGFNEAERDSLEMRLYSAAPFYADFDTRVFANSLKNLGEELGPDHPAVKIALAGKDPLARAKELVSGSKLSSVEERRRIAAGGADAIDKSTDPMIVLAREIEPLSDTLNKRRRAMSVIEDQAYDKIAAAWRELNGKRRYPDGTFTPRISFGLIKGYEENAKWIAPFTTLAGLYQRADEHKNEAPWNLPKKWLDKKAALALETPFNFVSTNDIIGGNSGSPVLNANAEVIGLIFDGNIHSLIGDYYFDETQNRGVSVDTRGILEALSKVYEASALVKELTR